MMRSWLLLSLLGIALLLPACQSTQDDTVSGSSNAAAVSQIPWNKPASWEGAGALGGFSPQGGH